MAVYNIGRVAYVNKGAYNAATVYEKYDVVLYQNGSYAYINDTSAAGNVPTNATYWTVMLDPTDMNAATEDANDAAALANEKAGLANTATTNANNATIAANEAVKDIEDILPMWSDVDVDVTEVEPGNSTLASISQDVDGTHIDLTLPTDMTKWAAVDILASDLDEGESATAGVSQDGNGTHFTVGIPKGDTGDSGTYIGDEEPTNPLKTVWLDTDEPDLMANYQDMMDATAAANASGPVSASRTTGDGTPGTTDTYTIVYGNGNTTSYDVYNGADAPSLAGVHQYIIQWDKVNSQCTRMGDAAAITTVTTNFGHFGATNPTYNNPFDELYPWKYRKLCKVDRAAYALLDPGSPITDAVTAWEGEPGFVLDGTGDFDGVYTPEFWGRIWEDSTYVYAGVADGPIPGWQYFEATIGGRYFGSMDGASKITSIAGAIPLRNTRMDTMHTNLTGQEMTCDDIFTWCADTLLMAVEFATLNSQTALGNGVDALYRQSAETVGENASSGATLLKLPNAFVADCVPGAIIGIGTTNGAENVAITRFISSADLYGADPLYYTHKGVTVLALTANVITSHLVCVHGMYNAPDAAIGSMSGYLGTNRKSNAYYRGRVAHANFLRYCLGVYRQTGTGAIWVANSRVEAAAADALNTGVHRDTGKSLPETSNYIASLHLDNLLPFAPFTATTGGSGGSAIPVGDFTYVPSLATGNTVLLLGGHANNGVYAGRFYGYWNNDASSSSWDIGVLPFLKTP